MAMAGSTARTGCARQGGAQGPGPRASGPRALPSPMGALSSLCSPLLSPLPSPLPCPHFTVPTPHFGLCWVQRAPRLGLRSRPLCQGGRPRGACSWPQPRGSPCPPWGCPGSGAGARRKGPELAPGGEVGAAGALGVLVARAGPLSGRERVGPVSPRGWQGSPWSLLGNGGVGLWSLPAGGPASAGLAA